MNGDTGAVRFFYGTRAGRVLLRVILNTHADRAAVRFLCSGVSRRVIGGYARRNGISLPLGQRYRSFQEFFCRSRNGLRPDRDPASLISPCDGWLSVCPVAEDSRFFVKGSYYRLSDLLRGGGAGLPDFSGGVCLIFRLTPSDYHHYCYIDDGFQGANHYIEGTLHSVQSAACERYPVYSLNRRSWTILSTQHFGEVAQAEIGALVVGGIVNDRENAPCRKGAEKGHFELAGSTILLLFQRGRIALFPEIEAILARGAEARVEYGRPIGRALGKGAEDGRTNAG